MFDSRCEESVLALILTHPEESAELVPEIEEEYFFVEENRKIARHVLRLFRDGEEVNPVSVLRSWELEGDADGDLLSYLTTEAAAVSLQAFPALVGRLKELSVRRQVYDGANELALMAQDKSKSFGDIQDKLAGVWERLFERGLGRSVLYPNEIAKHAVEVAYSERGKDLLLTGFPGLDRMLVTGIAPGELSILAGRPGMGKTSLRIHLSANWLMQGRLVYVYSPEQKEDRELAGYISWMTGISVKEILLTRSESMSEIERAAQYIKDNWKLVLDTEPKHQAELFMEIKRAQAAFGRPVDVAVVDLFDHLADLVTPRWEKKTEAIKRLVRAQQQFAAKNGVHVMNVWQLSREAEKRQSRRGGGSFRKGRPVLSDLADSGAAEQAADLIFFVHRESYYDPDTLDEATELILAKQRTIGGSTGYVRLRRVGDLRFEEEEGASFDLSV